MPDWYEPLVAARWLGVAPWELAQQPEWWTRWALKARRAEAEAIAGKQKAQQQNAHVTTFRKRRK